MKTIKRGEVLPIGFFRMDEGYYSGPRLCLRLPVLLWHRDHYDVSSDRKCIGWCAFNILLKSDLGGLNVRWGWVLVKQTGPYRSISGLGC